MFFAEFKIKYSLIKTFNVKSEAQLITRTENDAQLDCKRNGRRFNLEKHCVLYHNGVRHSCKTVNISISGVQITASDFPPVNLKIGDVCGLSFSHEKISALGEYESKVTRVGLSMVALSFLSLTF
jgi:hypothetical protein